MIAYAVDDSKTRTKLVQLDIRKNVITIYKSIEFTHIYESIIKFEYKGTEYQKCKKQRDLKYFHLKYCEEKDVFVKDLKFQY